MRARNACGAIALLAVAQLSFIANVFAQRGAGGEVDLLWNASPDCPSRDAVLAEMQRVLGGSPSRGAQVKVNVKEIAHHHWSEHLSTDVDGVTGERDLDADSCESLAAATALILAWTIDPQRAAVTLSHPRGTPLESPAPPSETTAIPSVPATPKASAPPPPPPVPPSPSPSRLARPRSVDRKSARYGGLRGIVAIDVIGDLGTAPGVGAAGRFTLGALLGRARVEASIADWVTEDARALPPSSNEGTTLHPLEAALRGCFRWAPIPRLEVDPCIGAGFTHVTSNGFNETAAIYTGQTTWASAYGDAFGAWTFADPLALRASLGLAVPLEHPSFEIAEPAGQTPLVLHHVSAIAGRATLGVEVRFP